MNKRSIFNFIYPSSKFKFSMKKWMLILFLMQPINAQAQQHKAVVL